MITINICDDNLYRVFRHEKLARQPTNTQLGEACERRSQANAIAAGEKRPGEKIIPHLGSMVGFARTPAEVARESLEQVQADTNRLLVEDLLGRKAREVIAWLEDNEPHDAAVLRALEEGETRKTVLKAIRARL